MKRSDDAFLELYNFYQTDPEEGDLAEMTHAYQNVLHKAGLSRRGGRRIRKILLVAAVLAAAGLTVAAAVYRASDTFHGVLDLHETAPQTADGGGASSPQPVLDRAGVLLEGSDSSGSVTMTLRAAAGDEHHIKVLLDVVNQSGAPLAIRQPDGTLSAEELFLDQYRLTPVNGELGSYSARVDFLDNDRSDSRATLLLSYSLSGVPVRGERFRLELRDIMQTATLEGTPLEMQPDALYELASAFDPVGENGFRVTGYTGDGDRYHYSLTTDSGRRLPLSDDTSVVVTNAAIRDGVLLLRGHAANLEELEQVLDNAALINPTTGEKLEREMGGRGDDPLSWTLNFEGVDSAEALRGFVWYHGEGWGGHTLVRGSWNFEFTVDVEDTTVNALPAVPVRWEDHSLTVDRIELSPFTLYLEYSVDEATARAMFPLAEWGVYREPSVWQQADREIILTMRDGGTVRAWGPGSEAVGESWCRPDDIPTQYLLHYVLDAVIDPDQVVSLTVGDAVIPLQPLGGEDS